MYKPKPGKEFSSHPKSKYWSYKNFDKLEDVSMWSKKKYWFICEECDHEFEVSPNTISNMNSWCSYCSNRKLCGNVQCIMCLEKSFASNPKHIYWSSKNEINPEEIFKNCNKKYLFDCEECNHEFEVSPNTISNMNSWCPYCSNRKLCGNVQCTLCLEKSFASNPKSKYWSSKNEINPEEVFMNSGKKYLFDCDKCYHDFESRPHSITGRDSWCPYCSNQKLCTCKLCIKKSFASHSKSKYWSFKNKVNPETLFKFSDKKYWFNCYKCHHEFNSKLTIISQGCWCPYCSSPPKLLCGNLQCTLCLEKSFANNPKSKYWSSKNEINPEEVFMNSDKKNWFNCDLCSKEFAMRLSDISLNGSWCPFCKNKTELKLYKYIEKLYIVEREVKYDWCLNLKTNKYYRFDFVIESKKIIIELDGPQHFKQVSNWKCPIETTYGDNFKMQCAITKGYTIIRLPQENVLKDNILWKEFLEEHIKIYDVPSLIILPEFEELYKNHFI